MLPFEFIVEGPPVSLNARGQRKQKWKAKVSSAAKSAMQLDPKTQKSYEPVDIKVQLVIVNYYIQASPDVDNIIKPIQDALEGIVYHNDNQVFDTRCIKVQIDGNFRIKNPSPLLISGLQSQRDFLHIRVAVH